MLFTEISICAEGLEDLSSESAKCRVNLAYCQSDGK